LLDLAVLGLPLTLGGTMAKPEEELVTRTTWHAMPTASTSERKKRLQQIEDNPNTEVRFIVQVSPGHCEILYTEKQHVHPPSKDARAVNKEKQVEAARAAAREARKQAEDARKAAAT
jgi:hypothetical protein